MNVKRNFRVIKCADSEYFEKFYTNNGRWYIMTRPDGNYLHSDGSIQEFTINKSFQYTGLYKTREAARQAVRAYKERVGRNEV